MSANSEICSNMIICQKKNIHATYIRFKANKTSFKCQIIEGKYALWIMIKDKLGNKKISQWGNQCYSEEVKKMVPTKINIAVSFGQSNTVVRLEHTNTYIRMTRTPFVWQFLSACGIYKTYWKGIYQPDTWPLPHPCNTGPTTNNKPLIWLGIFTQNRSSYSLSFYMCFLFLVK